MLNPTKTRSVLILAGGKSSRMGTPKGLLSYAGRPWLLEQFVRLKACGVTQATLVLGHRSEEYFTELPELSHSLKANYEFHGIRLCTELNKTPDLGPFSSLIQGLKINRVLALSPLTVFVLPVDVPCPEVGVWEALEEAMIGEVEAALPAFQGRGGHPVAISRALQEKLTKIPLESDEARLDVQIRAIDKEYVRYVTVSDSQIHMNFNTQTDWSKFRESSP